jgi:hypothetical protein
MKKTIEHKRHKATIHVILNHRAERHPDGDQFHAAYITSEDGEYKEKYETNTKSNLEDALMKVEQDFIDHIDSDPSAEEKTLIALGYSK